LGVVAPPARAVPMRLSTVLGWDTARDSVNPSVGPSKAASSAADAIMTSV
jgi:hypothetical protein